MENNFLDISYLKTGNLRQRKAYDVLISSDIISILTDFNPILTGTIPIGIDIEESDLDIVCKMNNPVEFYQLLSDRFGNYTGFNIYYKTDNIIVCSFYVEEMMIEIFGSPLDSIRTNAYRHMVIENRILNLLGEGFKRKVIGLKEGGLKTEPAFAFLLGLKGNPYEELLDMEGWADEEIKRLGVETRDV